MKMKIKAEILTYIIFGLLTTVVNIAIFLFFTEVLKINYIISNIIAWFLSVLFAYITNRIWVFESTNDNIIKELSLFYVGRVFSGVVDTLLLYILISIFSVGVFTSKIIVQVLVVILNYVLSKVIVFKE